MSPNPDPEAELEFKEGDLIKVFGEENEDGFYSAKVSEIVIIAMVSCVFKMSFVS